MNVRLINTILAWIGSILGAAIFVRLGVQGNYGQDSHAYWLAFHGGELYEGRPEQLDAYLYSPIFAQILSPLGLLSWPVFAAMWASLGVAATAWLVKPIGLRWGVPLGLFALTDIVIGNIYVFLGVMIALGARRPAAWAFGVLTKIVFGVGILWLLARREWRAAMIAIATTLGLAAVSYAVTPGLWFDWFEMLTTSGSQDVTLIPRCIAAVVVAVTIARRRPEWLAVAAVLATPVFNAAACLVPLLSIIRLREALLPFPTPTGGPVSQYEIARAVRQQEEYLKLNRSCQDQLGRAHKFEANGRCYGCGAFETVPGDPNDPDVERDPCSACGRPDVLDGEDVTAHWVTPSSDIIGAWSCCPRCSEHIEAQRVDGRLPLDLDLSPLAADDVPERQ